MKILYTIIKRKGKLNFLKQVEYKKETVYNFNAQSKKCATTSNILLEWEHTSCFLDTGAFSSFISDYYCLERGFKRHIIINRKNWVSAKVQYQ